MLKSLINKIHLWLGLGVGIIVFILAITGCIYTFQTEIQDLTQPYRFVEAQNKPLIPPSRIREIAKKEVPGKLIHSVLYTEKTRAALVTFYQFEPEYYYQVFINQYTGEVLKVKNMDEDFFRFVLNGHFYLWLPRQTGQAVVATSTLLFILILITGTILWIPRSKAALKQSFKIKFSTKWQRTNYDLHNVLGFYVSWVSVIFAVTGLVWGFEWFAKSYYYTLSGGKQYVPYYESHSDTTQAVIQQGIPGIDYLWEKAMAENPGKQAFEVHYPETKNAAIIVSTNADASTYWQADHRYYDQYTLQEMEVKHQFGRFNNQLSTADNLIRMNYDIHTGAIFGLTGKILAFFMSLIIASLPITGFLIWYGRNYKKDKISKQKRNLITAVSA
ncbi:MAG: PepSY domain-containing protein [Bacteroidia bacterium]|nr:PepSY domain-containing protein [Bacteroidia bacterium]